MSLKSGTKLGPYEILAPIGAGGMGEVYKAKDTRLDRTVAIKVLPSHLADNPDLKQRFEREARAVSSLNHPHICTLHDIGEQEGTEFMVMEYIEGETLADRLKKGALPLDQALRHGIEIADALDKAHRQGVVHRDLKPGNIMLTKSGAKLLDFGLAKLKASELGQEASVLSALPTEEKPLTEKGSILGTFQYMAPEQLEGKDADGRTDIFAFGAVLYEMVTGQRAFEGKSQASLIGAIMEHDPQPMSALQSMTPPLLDHVVKTCLAKGADNRWQTAGDVERQLRWIAEGDSAAGVSVDRRPSRSRLAWGIVVGLMVGAIAASVAVFSVTRPAKQPSTRFQIEFSPREMLFSGSGPVVALSPDGTRLAHVGETDGATGESRQLYIRSLDRLEATPLSETGGATAPFFSPDGEWLGFFAGGELKKVSVYGGAPVTLCVATTARGGSWGPGGIIVFSPRTDAGLYQVPDAGGTPEELTVLGEGERSHRWPHFLPNGKTVLFISRALDGSNDDAKIETVSLATGKRKLVHEGGTQPRYVPSGHLVYAHQGTLFGAPFDLDRLETTAPPVPVMEGVMSAGTAAGDGSAQFSFSNAGKLVYLSGVADFVENYTLVWVDREGVSSPLSEQEGEYVNPRFSPDGRRLALTRDWRDVWIYEMERGTMTRLTFAPGVHLDPVWSPDGGRLAFCSERGGETDIYWKSADGTGDAENLTESSHAQCPSAWSPDGRVLAFSERHPETGPDIWVLPLEGKREPQLFLRTPFIERNPRFSPDGNWLAYESNESGQNEVYVQSYPGQQGKYQISTDGGLHPLWGPEGRELFYRRGNSMMAVSYKVEGDSFLAGRPRELFQGQYRDEGLSADIAPNGKGFVMLQSVTAEEGKTETSTIILVTHWFEELKRLVPTEN